MLSSTISLCVFLSFFWNVSCCTFFCETNNQQSELNKWMKRMNESFHFLLAAIWVLTIAFSQNLTRLHTFTHSPRILWVLTFFCYTSKLFRNYIYTQRAHSVRVYHMTLNELAHFSNVISSWKVKRTRTVLLSCCSQHFPGGVSILWNTLDGYVYKIGEISARFNLSDDCNGMVCVVCHVMYPTIFKGNEKAHGLTQFPYSTLTHNAYLCF